MRAELDLEFNTLTRALEGWVSQNSILAGRAILRALQDSIVVGHQREIDVLLIVCGFGFTDLLRAMRYKTLVYLSCSL